MTRKTILEAIVGSTVHGTAVDDGLEDLDLMAIVLESRREFIGFYKEETWTHRTKPQGVRSEAGDVDWVGYGLRKYLSLALRGNPSILLALFVDTDSIREISLEGSELRAMAGDIVSKQAFAPFRGYMRQQYERLMQVRGQRNVTRPELVAKYGYDCYLDDTEFLTRRGWLTYDAVGDDDLLATINQATGEMEFQAFTDRVAKDYTGDLMIGETRYSRWAVTPNHRMYVSKVERGPSGALGSGYRPDVADWRFVPAADVADLQWHQRVAAARRDREHPVSDAYLELLGAYVSEGCVGKRLVSGEASVLRFEQKDGGRLHEVMARISAAYPTRTYCYEQRPTITTWTLADREVARRVAEECGDACAQKRLPDWVLDLSGRQADLLLNAMLAGDGTPYRTGGWVYYTVSRQLADRVQALALSAGRRCNLWGPYALRTGEPPAMFQVFIQDAIGYQILPFRGDGVETVPVRDRRVVCFTVPNETLVTRRNGRVAMHGNTKYAGHIIRLGLQGEELMQTGRISLPMRPEQRELVRKVRTGGFTLPKLSDLIVDVEARLVAACHASTLPERPNEKLVEQWMIDTYLHHWSRP